MKCKSKPDGRHEGSARGPGRGIAALIAGFLVGGGAIGWASGSDIGPDRTGVWAMPGGEVPGQAGTLMGQTDRGFSAKRDRFVKRMNKKLAEVDEQVEMIDEILAGRVDARLGEEYDDTIERGLIKQQNLRAELRYRRADAQDAVDHARAATEDRWPELRAQTEAALAALETAYDNTVRGLH